MREEWIKCRLKDVCTEISYGYTASANDNPVGPKFLRITDIVGEAIKWDSVPFCQIDDKIKDRYKLVIGDIVIARTGATTGSIAIIKDTVDSVFASYLIRYRINQKKAIPFFIEFLLRSNLWNTHVQNIVGGSAQPGANAQEFASFEFNLPSLATQQKIARILGTLDGIIARTEAVIAKYKALKAGLLQDLFTRGLDATGRLRPSPQEAPDLYKESALGLIPREWEVVKIKDHVESSAFGPRFPGEAYSEKGNIATLRTTDIDEEGRIDYKGMPLALLDYKTFEKHLLQENDLLITRSGTVGIASIFSQFNIPVLPGAFLIRFRFRSSINSGYLKEYFTEERGKKQLLNIAEGGVQKNIRGSSVLALSIPLPQLKEQIRISERIGKIDSNIQTEQAYLLKLQGIRSGLMADLLSGRVEVKPDAPG